MNRIAARLECLLAARSERGASAVEYGLLVAGIIVACLVGTRLMTLIFGTVLQAVADAWSNG